MKRVQFGICMIVMVVLFAFSACKSDDKVATLQPLKAERELDQKEQIEDIKYERNGITAVFPKIVAGGTKEELSKWNRLISSDFDQILHIYSFNPIPGPTPYPSAETPSILEIEYELKLLNPNLISILYKAYFNAKFSAHPTELIYTTNIDKGTSKRFRLKDVININPEFVKDFRSWEPVNKGEEGKEWNQAVKDYLDNISDEDLLMGMEAADLIGSKNLWGINSYYTSDKLGISIGVPNYIGDHVEFEREYTQLKDFIKPNQRLLP